MTIGGKPVSSAKLQIEAINPATEDGIATVPDATRAQLDAAVALAKTAFPAWSARPLAKRQALVARIGDAIEAHSEDLMRPLTRKQGKACKDAE